MLFNSIDFAIFLPAVFILYWFATNRKVEYQNFLLVIASYIFYGWWDWRFLFLVLFSTLVDFLIGQQLHKEERSTQRKLLLWTSITVNLGFLGFFKYYNFFLDNLTQVFTFFGNPINPQGLNIILPVGISFYTFQTLSYTIDIYNRKLEPSKSFITFAAFVSFFPQLVAGPIERATNLLPQFYRKRTLNDKNAIRGVKQIIWGLFKKIVVADTCAQYADDIFNNYDTYNSFTLILGAVYFSFQIYCDFSGYSDIAIGTSRLFGFKLMKNFSLPYFSRDVSEFWRRWHISLSTWFRDYVYIPLGGSKGSLTSKIKNTFIIFILSGFWHGANWTFIIWGGLNALYFLPLLVTGRNRKYTKDIIAHNRFSPSIREIVGITITYTLILFSWIFFRAKNVNQAWEYITQIFTMNFGIEKIKLERFSFEALSVILILLLFEWTQRRNEFPFDGEKKEYMAMMTLLGLIILFGNYSDIQSFIYFQF